MVRYQGMSVFGGVAIAPVRLQTRSLPAAVRTHVADTEAEAARFKEARNQASGEIDALREKTLRETDDEFARIFDVHRSMLFDADFEESVLDIIFTEQVNAAYAVRMTGERYRDEFLSSENAYLQAKALDILDITNRLIRILNGETEEGPLSLTKNIILAADDLTPSDCMKLDTDHILAIVTRLGGVHSHTAILARAKSIPMITGVDFDPSIDGREGIVDADEALLLVGFDEETRAQYLKKQAAIRDKAGALSALIGLDNVTKDGHRIDLFANIGGVSDVADALKNDAGGIGLFRSEYLYLAASDYPTEEEQFAAYREVAEKMGGRKVVIRTLDIGADKRVDYFGLPAEHNPALGYRAVRICLDRPEILKTQLRAILRASFYGNIHVMYPMITSVGEVRRLKELFTEVEEELTEEEKPFSDRITQGIMIETPAAVLISDELAQEVDFFSIGTNDLTQYLLACDRQNPALAATYDEKHPALLSAIRMTVENAHRHHIRVGICGEIAADCTLTEYFLSLKVDELSMTSSRILSVRDTVRSMRLNG